MFTPKILMKPGRSNSISYKHGRPLVDNPRAGCRVSDNRDGDLIVYENSEIKTHSGDSYKLVRFLGDGAFGRVYEAISNKVDDNGKKISVAVKISRTNPRSAPNRGLSEYKISEYIKGLARPSELSYINLVTSYFKYKDHEILISDLLQQNMYEALKIANQKAEAEAKSRGEPYVVHGYPIRVIKQAAIMTFRALSIIHDLSIIHLDIKPENIATTLDGDIRLIDFGMSIIEDEERYYPAYTPYYRAPEICLGLAYDSKADIWALGCTLFELFTSSPLIVGASDPTILKHIEDEIGPIPLDMAHCSPYYEELFEEDALRDVYEAGKLLGIPADSNILYKTTIEKGVSLEEFIHGYFWPQRPRQSDLELRAQFADLLRKCLEINPEHRISAREALSHPFLAEP